MEDGKHRSRREDPEKKENHKRSDRERNGERQREREKSKERERERSWDRENEKKDRDYRRSDRERNLEERHREKYKDSRHRDSRDKEEDGRSRHREDREREREWREKDDRAKLKEKERKRRELERLRDNDSEDDRDRDRKRRRREDDSARARSRDRERERNRDRYKEDEDEGTARSRDRDRERSRADRYKDNEDEGKRKRKEEDFDVRDRKNLDGKQRRNEDEDEEELDVRGRKIVEAKRRRNEESEEEIDVKGKKAVVEAENGEEEQRRLDEEMEKRRRRVQEWQELKRKKEENEREKRGEEKVERVAKAGKAWTLDGEESDDDEVLPVLKPSGVVKASELNESSKIAVSENGDAAKDDSEDAAGKGVAQSEEALKINANEATVEEEVDPLDAFMNSTILPEVEKLNGAVENPISDTGDGKEAGSLPLLPNKNQLKKPKANMGRIIQGEDSESDYEEIGEDDDNDMADEDDDEFMKRVKKSKVEKLSIVDHSKIQYASFRKNFYIEVKEISRMSTEEVAMYRKQLELKIRGKDVPKPVKTWNQTGLTSKVLEVIKKLNFEKPMPIQAQALPIIMSGRDCIGIAKTGSGKTLAFVLPMLRHIKDQPLLAPGDGPIGVIMAPTRELVQQIHSDIKKFSKVMGLSCVPVYGGSGVAQQISDLKRGAEIVVCTPGRMIDILCTSGGKITNLRRVTYLVIDEADRMFDMGFEPQITRIVQNTRPDRQTVLFSATFPRQVEILARRVLNKPVEIQVGGRSVVNKDITQSVEVRPESERFLRLLELLGEWNEKGKILVFVQSQEKCDSLFKELLRHGYPCLSLHGAKDQTDRESTISDFKSNVCNLLIATSVAARGLDVKELELVVNFDAPNHYEDYVHRVGRTGRAGRKGVAVTFISEEEARYAPDLVKALELSEQSIPEDLKKLADEFMAKVSQGTEHAHGTGYGGSGFKFNEEEEEARKAAKKAQAREYGFEEYDKSDSDSEDEGIRKAGGDLAHAAAMAQAAALAAVTKVSMTSMPLSMPLPMSAGQLAPSVGLSTVSLPGETGITGISNITGLQVATSIPAVAAPGLPGSFPVPNDAAARAAALAAALNLQHNLAKIQKDAMPEHYEAELEINDFPQNARWKVTHKETLGPISEWTGAAITTRGQYYPPGKLPGQGERKLYLFIEGPTESSVKKAKAEVKRVLEDYTAQAISLPGAAQPGKYSVL